MEVYLGLPAAFNRLLNRMLNSPVVVYVPVI